MSSVDLQWGCCRVSVVVAYLIGDCNLDRCLIYLMSECIQVCAVCAMLCIVCMFVYAAGHLNSTVLYYELLLGKLTHYLCVGNHTNQTWHFHPSAFHLKKP